MLFQENLRIPRNQGIHLHPLFSLPFYYTRDTYYFPIAIATEVFTCYYDERDQVSIYSRAMGRDFYLLIKNELVAFKNVIAKEQFFQRDFTTFVLRKN